MVAQNKPRASGKAGGDEIAPQEAERLLRPVQDEGELGLDGGSLTHPEDIHSTLNPAFRRMRTDWNSPDRAIIGQMRRAVDLLIRDQFFEIFDLLYEIYDKVRELDIDPATQEVKTDSDGLPEWKRGPSGAYVEDWTTIGIREREQYLYRITTGMFRWEQRAADLWGEALFAKAAFEEAFSHGYEELDGTRPTIEDRTARARIKAAEHRYRAVYLSYLSKRADAVVRSAERLGQRLKDLHSN